MMLNNSTPNPVHGFYCAIYLCGHKLFKIDYYIYFIYLLSKMKFYLHTSARWGKNQNRKTFFVRLSASVLGISLSMALNSFRKRYSHAAGQDTSLILEDPIVPFFFVGGHNQCSNVWFLNFTCLFLDRFNNISCVRLMSALMATFINASK